MVESQKMFEDMVRSIDRMRSEVTKLIGINEKAAFNQAEALIERLEQEIDELKKKESGLKQLYSTEDHIHFLQVGFFFFLHHHFDPSGVWTVPLQSSCSPDDRLLNSPCLLPVRTSTTSAPPPTTASFPE